MSEQPDVTPDDGPEDDDEPTQYADQPDQGDTQDPEVPAP